MSTNDWDIEKYRERLEDYDLWHLRRIFMEKWKRKYPEEKVVYLARAFANIALKGTTYPLEVMQEVARMSKDLLSTPSNKISGNQNTTHNRIKEESASIITTENSKNKIKILNNLKNGDIIDLTEPKEELRKSKTIPIDSITLDNLAALDAPCRTTLATSAALKQTPALYQDKVLQMTTSTATSMDRPSISKVNPSQALNLTTHASLRSGKAATTTIESKVIPTVELTPSKRALKRWRQRQNKAREAEQAANVSRLTIVSSNQVSPELIQDTSKGAKAYPTPRGRRAGKQVKARMAEAEQSVNVKKTCLDDTNTMPANPGTNKGAVSDASALRKKKLFVKIMTEPFAALSEHQSYAIKRIIEKILTAELLEPTTTEQAAKVRFRGKPHHAGGVLKSWCEDEYTFTWLWNTVMAIQSPIPNTKLVVRKEFQRTIKCGLLVPETNQDVNILWRVLAAQNLNVNVNSWIIIKAIKQTINDREGVFLILHIPESDLDIIKDNKLRLYWLTGIIYIRVLDKSVKSKPCET